MKIPSIGQRRMHGRSGLTLVELLIVLVILAVVTLIAIQSTENLIDQTRYNATTQTLQNIQDAIMGPANQSAPNGSLLSGFVGDMGRLPQVPKVLTTTDPLSELWDATMLPPSTPLYGMQTFNSTEPSFNNAAAFGLLNPPFSPYNSTGSATPVTATLAFGWRGPYLQLMTGSGGRLLDGWGNPFDSLPAASTPTTPAMHWGLANTAGTPIQIVRSLGADYTVDSTSNYTGYNADQYIPAQTVAPPIPATTTMLGFANPVSRVAGSVSVIVQCVNNSTPQPTISSPIAGSEAKPMVRVVLFAPVNGVLEAFLLDSSTLVNGNPTTDLSNVVSSTTTWIGPSAVDFPLSYPAPSWNTANSISGSTYIVRYADVTPTGGISLSPESSMLTTTSTAPSVQLPAVPAAVPKRYLFLTNGVSGSETLYATLAPTTGSVGYTLSSPDSTASTSITPASMSAASVPTPISGTFLNVPIGPRAIQAFQYDANTMRVTKRSPLTFLTVPAGGTTTQTLILQ